MRSPHLTRLWPHSFTPFTEKMSEVLIIAHRQFAINVLPSKGPLHFIAEAIEGSIKPPKLPSNGDRRLGIATVWVDYRVYLVGFDGVPMVLRVKAGIQG